MLPRVNANTFGRELFTTTSLLSTSSGSRCRNRINSRYQESNEPELPVCAATFAVAASGPSGCHGVASLNPAAVRAKTERFLSVHEVHGTTVSEPFVSVDKFAVRFDVDLTFKPTGQWNLISEIAIYTVDQGKIVHEEFLALVG